MKDGGPAFPIPAAFGSIDEAAHYPEFGMSLRDWFAGMALVGNLANPSYTRTSDKFMKTYAVKSYAYADMMLEVRAELTIKEKKNERDNERE